jgi:5'-nucleotidase
MRILVSNDDGIDAPGLALAVDAARRLTKDVWVVAPDAKRTAASNGLTVARPLTLTQRGPQTFACSGTPADCIVTAMACLLSDIGPPDLVLAGVNDGRNVGEDIAYSGTLGVAREATFWNVPAIGFSRVKDADLAAGDAEWLAGLAGSLWQARKDWVEDGHWLSVNLPSRLPAALVQARIGRDKIARQCEVLARDGDVTTLIIPRGRAHDTTPGDENDHLDRGIGTIHRLNWFGQTPLSPGLLAGLAATPD